MALPVLWSRSLAAALLPAASAASSSGFPTPRCSPSTTSGPTGTTTTGTELGPRVGQLLAEIRNLAVLGLLDSRHLGAGRVLVLGLVGALGALRGWLPLVVDEAELPAAGGIRDPIIPEMGPRGVGLAEGDQRLPRADTHLKHARSVVPGLQVEFDGGASRWGGGRGEA